ncbi:MAG: hypothetical protein L3J35_04560 [Bacteroidales bacterium]|nr:hypothetical protein [Bacteroidales bacterium]
MNRFKTILNLDKKIFGVNARNRILVYPNNKKKDFILANDKIVTKQFFEHHNIPHPNTYAIIDKIGEINKKWSSLLKYKQLVIKPANGKAGGGILVLNKETENTWKTQSGKKYTYRDIRSFIANIIFGIYSFGTNDRTIVEYQIQSHNFFKKIYSKGVPDIRIITYKKIIINIMLRIPTDRSDGKANLHQGAIGVSVDLETGILKKAYDYKSYEIFHPDSKVIIEGLQIPFWQEILSISQKIANNSPLLFLGIDIAIDEYKGPLVLEINARPGIEIQNVTQTGLRDLLYANKI